MKDMIQEEIGSFPVDNEGDGELDTLLMYLDKLKVETGGVYHNITFHVVSDYDGHVEDIEFYGHRLETDEEYEKRTEKAQKIHDAWKAYDKEKGK
jgi:hypothetical protein